MHLVIVIVSSSEEDGENQMKSLEDDEEVIWLMNWPTAFFSFATQNESNVKHYKNNNIFFVMKIKQIADTNKVTY